MKMWSLLLLFIPCLLPAQSTYVKTIGTSGSDYGTSCIALPDQGTALTICGGSATGDVQFGLVRTDYNGVVLWDQQYGYDNFMYPQQVVSTNDGGFLIFGTMRSLSSAGQSLFLLRTDENGNELWIRSRSTSGNDKAVGIVVQDDGFVTCSVTDYNTGMYHGALLIRYDNAGNELWARKFDAPMGLTPVAVTGLPDGGIAFVSVFKYLITEPFNHILVTKTDAGGNEAWSSCFGLAYDDEPADISADAAGNIFICGTTYRMDNEWDGFLLKVDPSGSQAFNHFYDAETSNGEKFRSLLVRADGSVLVAGDMGAFEQRDITLLATNTSGTLLWAKRYPLSPDYTNYPYDLINAGDGSIIFTGDVRSPSYVRDAALVKTDPFGNTSCFSQDMSFQQMNMPFNYLQWFLTGNNITLPAAEAFVPEHPLSAITEKIVCENIIPITDFSFAPADVDCPAICMSFSDLTLNDPVSWLWEFEGATPAFSTDQHPQQVCYSGNGTYEVKLTATNSNGSFTKAQLVNIDSECAPAFPNVLTPNGDGVNDLFFIQALPENAVLHILNRWGTELFASDDLIKSWNGRDRHGNVVPDGVYFYRVTSPEKTYHGFLHLLR